MKHWIFSLVASAGLLLVGCQSTEHADHSGHSGHTGATGSAMCSKCDCKHYAAGRLIKGVCRDCGHTAEEHGAAPPPAK